MGPSTPQTGGALRVGVIGFGYWGPNLARNFQRDAGVELAAIADADEKRRASAAQQYKTARIFSDGSEVIREADIDAVVVATPPATHFAIVRSALEAGKHVFVTKPFVLNSAQARELNALAAERKRVVMVDHTYIFTSAVRKMKEILDSGELGKLFYFDSVRINLGLFQTDSNVIWDLATHDLSILDYLIGETPESVAGDPPEARSRLRRSLP